MDKELLLSTQQKKTGFYESRAIHYASHANKLQKKHFQYSIARLVIFILGVAGMILSGQGGIYLVLLVGFLTLCGFSYCLFRQFKLEEQKKFNEALSAINSNEIEIIVNRNNIYYDGSLFEESRHNYSLDLDVFGEFSLYNILNRTKTYCGLHQLSEWLTQKPDRDLVISRSQAIQELESQYEFRQEFAAHFFSLQDQIDDNPAEIIKRGLESDFSFAAQAWLRAYRFALPVLWIAAGALYYFNASYGYLILVTMGLINFGISLRYASKVNLIQNNISRSLNGLSKYAKALACILDKDWNSTYIKSVLRNNNENITATQVAALKQLSQLIDLLDYRLHMLPSILLNIGLLWDSRITYKLGNWKSNHTLLVDEVFNIIGDFEALCSLSTWAFNNEQFVYAEIVNSEFTLKGGGLIHPLMQFDEAVANDFLINDGHYVSIITGSNMSGKSTMLRTLGVNIILAYAGTRVAANDFKIPLVELITYMRIKDALEENVSTFKAELNRVQQILELIEDENQVLILIDEMLRGTNSKDKLKGSIAFVKRILEQETFAVIATHDIQLTDMVEDHPEHIRNYFFDIRFRDNELEFDYKIREGVCDTFNASFLLGQMGLDIHR